MNNVQVDSGYACISRYLCGCDRQVNQEYLKYLAFTLVIWEGWHVIMWTYHGCCNCFCVDVPYWSGMDSLHKQNEGMTKPIYMTRDWNLKVVVVIAHDIMVHNTSTATECVGFNVDFNSEWESWCLTPRQYWYYMADVFLNRLNILEIVLQIYIVT